MSIKKQKGIWIPEKENWNGWSVNYENREYQKLQSQGIIPTGNSFFVEDFREALCLDIGAHVGIWTKRLSRDFSEVISFEPLPKHIECHKVNCKGLSNVTLHECALSNADSESIMSTKDFNSGMSSLGERGFKNKEQFIVKTKRLDSFNFPMVDFIKMDVEGYEEQVLEGGKETIERCKPDIYIEIWDKNVPTVSKILNDMGYALTKMSQQNYLAVIQ